MSSCMLGELIREHLFLIIGIAALVVLTPIIALRIYAHLTLGVCVSKMTMKGKTVIVTGANSGIGKETAKEMAKRGAKVIMACRNLEVANEVRDEIAKATNNENVVVRELDLSSNDSIRSFAAEINKTEPKLDVLIHNAGMANTFGRKTNKEGVEITMATNHYGPFLLTHLLIDLLKRSAPSRIVVVASELYRFACLNLNNPNPVSSLPAYPYYALYNSCCLIPRSTEAVRPQSRRGGGFRALPLRLPQPEQPQPHLLKRSAPSRIVVVASELYRLACLNLNNPNPVSSLPAYLYYVSKYANIVFTKELARKLEGTNVTVNCLHPGMIDSGIWRNVPFPLNLPLNLIVKGFFKTPEQGAQTSIHLAVSEEVEGVSGKYFMDCKEHGLSRGAEDPAVAKKFWELSEELAGLKATDPHL